AAGSVFFDWAGDAPVMGESDGFPGGVVEGWGLGSGGVGLEEAPVGGELLDLAWVGLCCGQERREKQDYQQCCWALECHWLWLDRFYFPPFAMRPRRMGHPGFCAA